MAQMDRTGKITLVDPDKHEAGYKELVRYAVHRVGVLTSKLKNDLDEIKTAKIRGAIRELEKFLSECEPKTYAKPKKLDKSNEY